MTILHSENESWPTLSDFETFRDTSSWKIVRTGMTILLSVAALFALMHVVSLTVPPPLDSLQVWFDLNKETSIASWFSASQLLVVGLVFAFAAWWRWHDRTERLLLATAGAGFMLLSADEAAMIHERITLFTVNHDFVPRFRGDHGVWIFLYGALGLGLVLAFLRSILVFLRRRTAPALLVGTGFAIIVLGAVGFEVMMYYEVMTGPFQTGAEEILEMIGGSLMVCGSLVLANSVVSLTPRD